MDYIVKTGIPEKQKTDCIVAAVFDKKKLSASASSLNKASNGQIAKALKLENLQGNPGETLLLTAVDGITASRVLLIGAGKLKDITDTQFHKLTTAAVKAIKGTSAKDAIFCWEDIQVKNRDLGWQVIRTIEICSTAAYVFNQLKSGENKKTVNLKKLAFASSGGKVTTQIKKAIATGASIASGMDCARDLGNLPGNICTPAYLAKEARALGRNYTSLSIKVLEEKDMKALGMGAFLSVSAGSDQPAKLIIMEHKGCGKEQAPHILVGKGITFDTGGISLKPGADMDQMKFDMCGAASVIGTLKTISELNLPLNVIGIVAAAENMPGGSASRPGDIVTTMSGQTVEILNTDAEGRLVLCDALTYVERYEPASVIDIATLTGACLVALGNHASGMLSNSDNVTEHLKQASEYIGDKIWQLPLWDEYQQQLDSPFADMTNLGGRNAGTITAACFLSRYTKEYPWAHLDIAGTAWISSGPKKGATGRPVPLLTQYLIDRCK